MDKKFSRSLVPKQSNKFLKNDLTQSLVDKNFDRKKPKYATIHKAIIKNLKNIQKDYSLDTRSLVTDMRKS